MPTYNVTEIYNGRTWERDTNGITTTIVYCGSKTDCQGYANSQTIGVTAVGLGKLASVAVAQAEGAIYHVTLKYQNANGSSATSGNTVTPPDYSYGTYSATMDGSMFSSPLETHRDVSGNYDYKCCWNNFLIVKYPAGTAKPSTPTWWSTLGANPSTGEIGTIPDAYQGTFFWQESGTLPQEDGYTFAVLQNPTMAGYQSYDRALFTQTESARFRNYLAACESIAKKLNHTGTPTYNNYGSYFQSGNWKCDRATVTWTGDYWLATLTWTYSPDGWNSTLYSPVPA